jgi:hypothetical protein
MRRAAAENRQRKPDIQTDAKKFHPGIDPLEAEESLTNIVPVGQHEHKQLMQMLKKMLKKTNNGQEANAIRMQIVNAETGELKGVIHKEFLRDFWAWILGRGKETDHKKTPWYRQSLADDNEVSHYIDSFVIKMQEFRVKLAILGMRRPTGINQTYLFFKYIVRGEEVNKANFLEDWKLFQDEFYDARKQGQRERNLDDIEEGVFDGEHNAHEMAPYGAKERKRLADARQEKFDELPVDEAGSEEEQTEYDGSVEMEDVDIVEMEAGINVDEAREAAVNVDRAAGKRLSPEQKQADLKAQTDMLEEIWRRDLEEFESRKRKEADAAAAAKIAKQPAPKTDDAADEKAKEKIKRNLESREKARQRREKIAQKATQGAEKRNFNFDDAAVDPSASKVGSAASGARDRVNEIGNNVAEGLQTPADAGKEAKDLADKMRGIPFEFDPMDIDSAETKNAFDTTMFEADAAAEIFDAPAPDVPAAAKEIAKKSAKKAEDAFKFVPPPKMDATYTTTVCPKFVALSPEKNYIFTSSVQVAVEVANSVDNGVFGESEDLPPKDKEEMDEQPKNSRKADEAELGNTEEPEGKTKIPKPFKEIEAVIEKEKVKLRPKRKKVQKTTNDAARHGTRLAAATTLERELAATFKLMGNRAAAEMPRPPSIVKTTDSEPVPNELVRGQRLFGKELQMAVAEAVPPSIKIQKKAVNIGKKRDAAQRLVEEMTPIADATIAEAKQASINLEIAQEKAEKALDKKKRQVVKDVHADYQSLGNLIAKNRKEPVAPGFVRTTAPVEPKPPMMIDQRETQARAAAAVPPEFVRTTAPVEPVAPGFVRTTAPVEPKPPMMIDQRETQARAAATVPPEFVRTTAPVEQKSHRSVENSKEQTNKKSVYEGGRVLSGEEEFDEEMSEFHKKQAKTFNMDIAQITKFAKRYAPNLVKNLKPWNGKDTKQKKHLQKIALQVLSKMQSARKVASKPDNLKMARKLRAKVSKMEGAKSDKMKLK